MTRVNERQQPLSASESEWLRVRAYLREHRYELGLAADAELYPELPRVADTPLLTTPAWLPDEPIPLDRIKLDLRPDATAMYPVGAGMAPVRLDGSQYASYSDAMARLDAPSVFENRCTYRLLGADLRSSSPRLTFGLGHYFDGIDTGEAVGHEFAAQKLGLAVPKSQRDAIGSPVDPARRPTNLAISTLTIRHDRSTGDARFLVHWRDPAKVGHAGGLLQVIPVGIFQPATDHPDSLRNDFSLWRCLQREFAEELLGVEEVGADTGPIDYGSWPFAVEMDTERRAATIRAYCLGIGVDPLTLATDMLCVVVIDAPVFDIVFEALEQDNAEGSLVELSGDGRLGVAFGDAEISNLRKHGHTQAAGAAVLALAWQHMHLD